MIATKRERAVLKLATKAADARSALEAAEQADEALWLDVGALQAGARLLFMRAVKTHAGACDEPNDYTRKDSFEEVDGLIDDAQRLLAMARAMAEKSHPEEE